MGLSKTTLCFGHGWWSQTGLPLLPSWLGPSFKAELCVRKEQDLPKASQHRYGKFLIYFPGKHVMLMLPGSPMLSRAVTFHSL